MYILKNKILNFLFVFLFFFKLTNAQKNYNLEFGFATGASNYLGDIGGGLKEARPTFFDLKLIKTRPNQTLFVKYKISPNFSVKGAVNYLRITGDDKITTNPGRKYRNLSFRNDIFDIETTVNYLFYNPILPLSMYPQKKIYLTGYLFSGVGIFYHNPKALYNGDWVALQPLKTEGQSSTYSKMGVSIPMGVGFYFTIIKRGHMAKRIGLEINWRYTTTDYLDDISSNTWANPANLNSSEAVALSNRNPELGLDQPNGFSNNYGWVDDGNGNNANNAPRGNPDSKDSYVSVNLCYSIVIKGTPYRKNNKKRKIQRIRF